MNAYEIYALYLAPLLMVAVGLGTVAPTRLLERREDRDGVPER